MYRLVYHFFIFHDLMFEFDVNGLRECVHDAVLMMTMMLIMMMAMVLIMMMMYLVTRRGSRMVWRRCVAWRRNRELVRHNRWWWHLIASFLYLCFLLFVFVVFVRAYFPFSIFLICEVLTAPGGRRSQQAWATRRGSRWTRWTSGCTEW